MFIPTSTELINPIVAALRSLGDSAGLKELENRVAALSGLPDEVLSEAHVRNRGTDNEKITATTEFGYRLRWALTYLKKAGFVTNSTRGVWAFTEIGQKTQSVDSKQVVSAARALGAVEELTTKNMSMMEIHPTEQYLFLGVPSSSTFFSNLNRQRLRSWHNACSVRRVSQTSKSLGDLEMAG